MNLFLTLLMFVLGLILIIYGGNFLVESSLKISKITGISEIIIGATIVSLATTLPEFLVTIYSSLNNIPEIAIGNSIGSMFFNLSIILGVTLLFSPPKVSKNSFKIRFILLMLSNIVVFAFGLMGKINYWGGLILMALFIAYFIYNFYSANKLVKSKKNVENDFVVNKLSTSYYVNHFACENFSSKTALNNSCVSVQSLKKPSSKKLEIFSLLFLFTLGAIGVSMGSDLLVDNGEKIANLLHINPGIIGATIIAMGTSLPELVTAITSIKRKSTNLAVGNILGANILNCTLLLGTASLFGKGNLLLEKQIAFIQMPLLILALVVLGFPILKRQKTFKWQGVVLLLIAVLYYIFMFI